jgi:hypothetical protein
MSRYRTSVTPDVLFCQDGPFDDTQVHENGHIYRRIAPGAPDGGRWVRVTLDPFSRAWREAKLVNAAFTDAFATTQETRDG